MRLPSNLRLTGFAIDAEHVASVGEIVRATENKQAAALLSSWARAVECFPFIVIAGEMHRARAGAVGGLAREWKQALALFRFAHLRLDEIAQNSPRGFTSAWVLLLTEERRAQLTASVAQQQATAGSA